MIFMIELSEASTLTFHITFFTDINCLPHIALTHLSDHILSNRLECIQDKTFFINAEKGVLFLCSSFMFTTLWHITITPASTL